MNKGVNKVKHHFNDVLQAGAEAEKSEKKQQEKLKRKYGITGKNVVVVDGSSTFKFTLRLLLGLVRFLATVLVLGLAFVGIVAIFYEAPRRELLIILHEVQIQISNNGLIAYFFHR